VRINVHNSLCKPHSHSDERRRQIVHGKAQKTRSRTTINCGKAKQVILELKVVMNAGVTSLSQ
jgi:hypothetical protein